MESPLDPVAPEAARRLAATRFADPTWVSRTGSTNADVLDAARDGAREGLVVAADEQTAGRGRRDRVWSAPPGSSLLVSILLRPPAPLAPLSTAALALSARDAVAAVTGVEVGIKWPNDLVVPGAAVGDPTGPDRKLAGVLAEADWPASANASAGWREPAPGDRVVVVAGIGLNVAWPADLPPELADSAVALNHLVPTVGPADRGALLVELLVALEARYARLLAGGPGALLAEWRQACVTLGRSVRVDLGADDVVGTAVDLDDAGHLVVETLDGSRRVVAVGDVVHVSR
jgi:BirA family biotin operon repressor/biotin-[acetyl-CoA-carboxylase] ligase